MSEAREIAPAILEKWAKEKPLAIVYIRGKGQLYPSTVLAAFNNKRKAWVI